MLESNTYDGTLLVKSICFVFIIEKDNSVLYLSSGKLELHVGERMLRENHMSGGLSFKTIMVFKPSFISLDGFSLTGAVSSQ